MRLTFEEMLDKALQWRDECAARKVLDQNIHILADAVRVLRIENHRLTERLSQPVEVVVRLDAKAVAEAVVARMRTPHPTHHEHIWVTHDGAYYCFGCKTFMPNAAALMEAEAQ